MHRRISSNQNHQYIPYLENNNNNSNILIESTKIEPNKKSIKTGPKIGGKNEPRKGRKHS